MEPLSTNNISNPEERQQESRPPTVQQISEPYLDDFGQIISSNGHHSETSFPAPAPPEIESLTPAQADQQFSQQIALSPDPLGAEFSEDQSHSQVGNPGYIVYQREPDSVVGVSEPEKDVPESILGAQTEATHPTQNS